MAKEKSPKTEKETPQKVQSRNKRSYIKQADVPLMSLDEALRIPQAIFDHYAGKPTSPLYIAKALNIDPKGAQIRFLSGASIAYGLIEGGAQASTITLTDLSKRILRPKFEEDELNARREAVLIPRIFNEFLTNYDGHQFPRQDIAVNVLEEMGVPRDKANEVLQRIENSALSVGFITEIKGKNYVTIKDIQKPTDQAVNFPKSDVEVIDDDNSKRIPISASKPSPQTEFPKATIIATAIANDERRKKVFITHGKNREMVEPIKKLLEYGELIPVVSVERQSVSKPVPEKVMDDMRMCGAAIIHVDADKTIVDKDNQEHVLINPNVLIEIGAAMAFYGRRFILLVREGVKLPSNLQGLYEVRYSNDALDANSTIKLLEAMKDIKNYQLPTDTTIDD